MSRARDKKELADTVGDIRLASRTLVRELGFLNRHLAGTELNPSQVHALLELERVPQTQAADLGNLFRLDKSAVSRLLADLKQRGFIATSASASDGRGRALQLTTKGRRQLKIIHDKANVQFTTALKAIDKHEWPHIVKSLELFARTLATTRKRPGERPARRRPRMA